MTTDPTPIQAGARELGQALRIHRDSRRDRLSASGDSVDEMLTGAAQFFDDVADGRARVEREQ